MWNPGTDRKTVVCIACGTSLLRTEAREYDKEGDRWQRRDKQFEYLCRECDDELCHKPRGDLESLLVSIEERQPSDPGGSTETFISRYLDAVTTEPEES